MTWIRLFGTPSHCSHCALDSQRLGEFRVTRLLDLQRSARAHPADDGLKAFPRVRRAQRVMVIVPAEPGVQCESSARQVLNVAGALQREVEKGAERRYELSL